MLLNATGDSIQLPEEGARLDSVSANVFKIPELAIRRAIEHRSFHRKSTNDSDGHLNDFRFFYVLLLIHTVLVCIQNFFENKSPVPVLQAFKVFSALKLGIV